MKRFMIFIIAIAVVCSLAACTAEQAPAPSPTPTQTIIEVDENALIEQSEEFSKRMAVGDFASVTEIFSDSIKSQLTVEELSKAWDDTVREIGAYVDVYDNYITPAKDYTIINIILRYEKNSLVVSFMYKYDGEIDGLWINYYTIPSELESSDLYEELSIQFGEGEIMLNGILTLPQSDIAAVAIFVHGSGQTDMDETIGAAGNKPFRDLARGLAEKGIASVRYNKRYYQYPLLVPADLTIQDEVTDDVGHAIEFIRSNAPDTRVSDLDIVLVGHSLGGMLAPKLALDYDDISAVVILAGSPRGLEDIILDQNLDVIESMEIESQETIDYNINLVTTEINRIKNIEEEPEGGQIMGIGLDYWKSLNAIDTTEICAVLEIPFLIMQGGADFQISPEKDFEAWKTAFAEKDNAEFKLYDNLNHLFMPTLGIRGIEDYDSENFVAHEVIDDISSWIHTVLSQ